MGFHGSYLWKLRQQVGHGMVLIPGAAVVVEDPDERLLLLMRSDSGEWCTPGGTVEDGSSFARTALTELLEETGLVAEESDLIPFACISEPSIQLLHYPNGDVTHCFAMWFALRRWTGQPRPDGDEIVELGFFDPNALPENLMEPARHSIILYQRFKETAEFQVS